MVFNFVETIEFLAFRSVNVTHKSSMFLFLAVLVLGNTRVHIDISNHGDVLNNVKVFVD